LNIERRDSLFDFLLAQAASIHVPSTRLIFAGDTASDDEVAFANLPFYFDFYVSFVASMTNEEVDICSTS